MTFGTCFKLSNHFKINLTPFVSSEYINATSDSLTLPAQIFIYFYSAWFYDNFTLNAFSKDEHKVVVAPLRKN